MMLCALPLAAAAACDRGISPAAALQLQDSLRILGSADGCAWAGLDTQASEAKARWRKGGQSLGALTIAPHGCLPQPTWQGATFDAALPAELAEACPRIKNGLADALGGVRPLLPVARDPNGGLFQRSEPPTRGIITAFAGLWLLALLLGFYSLFKWLHSEHPARGWLLQLAGGAAMGLAVRLSTPASLANWYLEVLGPTGAGDLRFGPGALGLQRLVFAIAPTADTTLFVASALVGAAAIPLTMAIARRVAIPEMAALAAGVLLAWQPLHVRVSVSGSAHIWASSAQLVALLLWISGLRHPDPLRLATSGLFAFLALATRIDVFAQLPVIAAAGWLLADPRAAPGVRRTVRRATALWFGAWLATGALVWQAVVRPSHHPPAALHEIHDAARHLLSQFWHAAGQSPAWVPALVVALAVIGLLHMALRDRRLIAVTALALLCTFVPLGRRLDAEGLVGGRYFCFVLAWISVLGGAGAGWMLGCLPRIWARWMLLAALTLAIAATARPALQARYTFEEEYDFLRSATAALPAGCAVLQLPVRDSSFEGDFDGCIDAPRSPLTLARPDLRWQYLKLGTRLPVQPEGCLAYYQTALCEIRDSSEVLARYPTGVGTVRRACAEALHGTSIRRLRDATLGTRTTHDLFGRHAPTVWLGRVGNGQ